MGQRECGEEDMMGEEICLLLKEGYSYKQIVEKLNCSKSVVSYHARKNGLQRQSSYSHYDWKSISTFYLTHTFSETKEEFGFSDGAWSKALSRGVVVSRGRVGGKYNLEDILIEGSTYSTEKLKTRLLKAGIFKEICNICGVNSIWQGRRLVLQLDHINGVPNDHRIDNLRTLCPNCHSQTSTYCGRNKKLP